MSPIIITVTFSIITMVSPVSVIVISGVFTCCVGCITLYEDAIEMKKNAKIVKNRWIKLSCVYYILQPPQPETNQLCLFFIYTKSKVYNYLLSISCLLKQTTVLRSIPCPIENVIISGKFSHVLCIRKRRKLFTGGNNNTLKKLKVK